MRKIYPVAIALGLTVSSACSNHEEKSVLDNCTRTYNADSLNLEQVVPDTTFNFGLYMDSLAVKKENYDTKKKDNYK